MGQDFRKEPTGWFTSDPCGVSGGGWSWKAHFQDGFVISISGPLVLLGFSPSTWHLILQNLSERYRLLLARWSQGRWVSRTVAGFPRSIQFKPPGRMLPVLFWLDLRNPLTALLSRPVILSSKSLKPAKIQGERNYFSVGGVAKTLQLTLIYDMVSSITKSIFIYFSGYTANTEREVSFTNSQFRASPDLSYITY